MTDNRNNPQQSSTEGAANQERPEQFNELSELSLEERMNVADQMGIPMTNVEDAVAKGNMRGDDDTREEANEQLGEEDAEEATDR